MSFSSEPIRVNGSQPLIPPPHLQLSGEVIGLLPNAALTVTAYVGGQAFPARVDGRTYSLSVGRPDDAQMVVLEARADRAHYRSVLGSAHRLRSLAGADSHLVLPEHSSLRISPYSSALAWQIRYALDGRDASSDAEFEQALRSVATDELGIIAFTLAAISMGDLALPAGFATGYDLLQQRDAFRTFVQQSQLGASASRYLFEQDDSAPVTSAAELGEKLVLLSGIPINDVPMQVADISLLERLSDGSFNLHHNQPTREPNYSLTLNSAGAVELHPVGAADRNYERLDPSPRLMLRASEGHTLRRLTKGQTVSLWLLQSRWLDHDLWNPEAPPQPVTEYRVLSSTSLNDWTRPDGWTGLLANRHWTHPWICLQPTGSFQLEQLTVCDYVRHDFRINPYTRRGETVAHGWSVDAQGQAISPATVQEFQWNNVPSSTLTVNTERVQTDFWRIKLGGTVAVPTIFLARASGGNAEGSTMVGLSLSLLSLLDSPLPFQPLGEWVMGATRNGAPLYLSGLSTITTSRQNDGTGWYRTHYEGVETQYTLSWQALAGGIYDKRHQTAPGGGGAAQPVTNCLQAMAAGATSCITQVRFFRPLALTLGRSYGIEEQYQITHLTPGTGPGAIQVRRVRSSPSYQVCTSGACQSIFIYPQTSGLPTAASIPRLDGSMGAVGYRPSIGIGSIAWILPNLEADEKSEESYQDTSIADFGSWRMLFQRESAVEDVEEDTATRRAPSMAECADSDCKGPIGTATTVDASVVAPDMQPGIHADPAGPTLLSEHVR